MFKKNYFSDIAPWLPDPVREAFEGPTGPFYQSDIFLDILELWPNLLARRLLARKLEFENWRESTLGGPRPERKMGCGIPNRDAAKTPQCLEDGYITENLPILYVF